MEKHPFYRWGMMLMAMACWCATARAMYDPEQGRWMSIDPLGVVPESAMNPFGPREQYADGGNLYEYVQGSPTNHDDALGLWGGDIHNYATRRWAISVGFTSKSASAIGRYDEEVDGGQYGLFARTSFLPLWGDQSYHFNRNLSGGDDTRLLHRTHHLKSAEFFCNSFYDDPEQSVKHLGYALHPLQDWVAHGDYALNDTGGIYSKHNSNSPQTTFGSPGDYPDDPLLDVEDSPDGRAWGPFIVDSITIKYGAKSKTFKDFAIYEKGMKRYELTRRLTEYELKGFKEYIEGDGGCKCKHFYLGK